MEVWQDYQTGKFFKVDQSSGRQSPSSRYGVEKAQFTAYSTGFSRLSRQFEPRIDKMYSVQPEKFDGYCQYPRPLIKSSSNRVPFVKSNVVSSKIFIKEKKKIPTPLRFLELSQRKSPSPDKSSNSMQSLSVKCIKTISELKNSVSKKPLKEMKTVTDLTLKMKNEKINKSGFLSKESKEPRRKLKGFFLREFKTSGELFKDEQRIVEITKPNFTEKIKKNMERDRQILRRLVNSNRKQAKLNEVHSDK